MKMGKLVSVVNFMVTSRMLTIMIFRARMIAAVRKRPARGVTRVSDRSEKIQSPIELF